MRLASAQTASTLPAARGGSAARRQAPRRSRSSAFAGEQVDTDRQRHKGIGGGSAAPHRAGRRLSRLAGERREPALQLTPHGLHQLFRRGHVDAEGCLHPEQAVGGWSPHRRLSRPAKAVMLCTSWGTTSAASSASTPKNSA